MNTKSIGTYRQSVKMLSAFKKSKYGESHEMG